MFDVAGEIRKMARVLSVATRPRIRDFEKMAKVTALGVIVIGIVGMAVSLIFEKILK